VVTNELTMYGGWVNRPGWRCWPVAQNGISDRALFVKGVSPEGTRSLCPSTREFSRGFLCAGARQ
jgi:hypothetical protein